MYTVYIYFFFVLFTLLKQYILTQRDGSWQPQERTWGGETRTGVDESGGLCCVCVYGACVWSCVGADSLPCVFVFHQAQRAVIQLKTQVNKLEAELEDQRTHKQMALVENERLRMEVDDLRTQTAVSASIQAAVEDAGSEWPLTPKTHTNT